MKETPKAPLCPPMLSLKCTRINITVVHLLMGAQEQTPQDAASFVPCPLGGGKLGETGRVTSIEAKRGPKNSSSPKLLALVPSDHQLHGLLYLRISKLLNRNKIHLSTWVIFKLSIFAYRMAKGHIASTLSDLPPET